MRPQVKDHLKSVTHTFPGRDSDHASMAILSIGQSYPCMHLSRILSSRTVKLWPTVIAPWTTSARPWYGTEAMSCLVGQSRRRRSRMRSSEPGSCCAAKYQRSASNLYKYSDNVEMQRCDSSRPAVRLYIFRRRPSHPSLRRLSPKLILNSTSIGQPSTLVQR